MKSLPLIGEGYFREVYAYDENHVIKLDVNDEQQFHNVAEWQMWMAWRNTWLGQWMAPCHFITNDGHCLVQSRCRPLTRDELPKRVPDCFAIADCKRDQWGMLGDRVVCLDYGILSVHLRIADQPLYRKPQWLL